MNKFKKSIITLSISLISTFACANYDIYEQIKSGDFNNIPEKVYTDDKRFPHSIPLSTFLLINNEEDIAINLIKSEKYNLDKRVTYKGIIYSEIEIAEILGFKKFSEEAKKTPKRNLSKEEIIKRNRKNMYTNSERIQSSVDREKTLIKKLKDGELEKILMSEKKEEILINILVKSIIDGHNELAEILANNIDDINKLNENGISPLMATGFSNYLVGGNVEFASKLIFDYNADIDLKNDHGMTAVHISSAGNSYKTLILLLDSGAKFMNVDESGNMPIDYAIQSKALESSFVLKKAIEQMKKNMIK